MNDSAPKNGFLVLILKLNGPEELVLTTPDGPIVIQIGAKGNFTDRARVIINAPKSIPIFRRKIEANNGRQG
jgi:sRNA-binding carbon storage regulator CsrA